MRESDSPSSPFRGVPFAALRAFDLAARLGSFRAAADAAGLTPSAISHQIKALERALGAPLFRRQGRAIALTEAGARLAPHVRQGFLAFERGAEAVRTGARSRQIRVSALALFSQTVLIPNLGDFARRWPGYELRIESTARFVDFDAEDVDVAIRFGDGRWPGVKATELVRITGVLLASRAFLERRPISRPADLLAVRRIHDAAQPRAWMRWFEAHGVAPPDEAGDLWFDTAPATLQAAEQGLGVAIGIDPLVRAWPGYGERLVPVLPGQAGDNGYWLVRRAESDADPKIRAFTAWIRAVCGDLGG